MARSVLHIRIDEDLKKRLDDYAKARYTNVSACVVRALLEFLEREEANSSKG